MSDEIVVLKDGNAIARHMAEWPLGRALAKQGAFALSLSGGSTPKTLYTLLASDVFIDRFPRGSHPPVLWRRTLRAARPSRQQLSHGMGRR